MEPTEAPEAGLYKGSTLGTIAPTGAYPYGGDAVGAARGRLLGVLRLVVHAQLLEVTL